MGRARDKSKYMLRPGWVVVIFLMLRLLFSLWKTAVAIPSPRWWSRYISHAYPYSHIPSGLQQSNSTSSKGKTLHLSPLSDSSFIPFPFLHIVLLFPQSLLTSQKAEPAHSRSWAMTTESESQEHALCPRPGKAEFSPQPSIWSDWWSSWPRRSCWIETDRERQRAMGNRERESQPDPKKPMSIWGKTEKIAGSQAQQLMC